MSQRYLLIAPTWADAPGVRVAADRLAQVDPEVPRSIVVLDEDPRSLRLLRGAGELVTGAELGLSLDLVGRWAGSYGEWVLLWCAFPHVAQAVGDPGDRLLWIHGDVEIAGPLTAYWDALETSELVAGLAAPSLAPHGHERPDTKNGRPYALQPVTAVTEHDGELVARSLLGWQAGSAAATSAFAQWSVPRDLPTHEAVATAKRAQQWFNALALRDDAVVVHAPGAVLSTAQLLSRTVGLGAEGEPTVDGAPLSLLALRGFDPGQPHLFEGAVVTARLSEHPELAGVLHRRAAALLDAGWAWSARRGLRGTRWDVFPEGLASTKITRQLVRSGLRSGTIQHSPFGTEGFSELREYATQPGINGGSLGINRLLHALHASRPDLHAAYPSLDGPDGLGFLGWAWVYGRDEIGIPESFLPPRPEFLDAAPSHAAARIDPDTKGVNLAGYFTSELGLGESARQIAGALEAAGVATTPVQGLLVPPTRQQAEFVPVGPQDAHHDVNVVVVNGDQMPFFAKDVGPGFFEGRPTIGVWWWEVDPFPAEEWKAALEWVDEVWVGTDFIRSLIEPHLDVPVWVFPVPVAVHKLDEPLPRSHFGFEDDETVFLYIWDYHSTEARKNPTGLVEAYRKAFPPGSKTRLVLKCINHENLPEADEKVRVAAAGRDDIVFIDRFLSGREKNALLELCDCYVSPHRSEGFGYTPAEAMLLGKPVIVTGYGGTTEYTDSSVARIIEWTLTDVGRGAAPYPPNGRWAEPNISDLTAHLRWIVDEPDAAAAMAERGRRRVAGQHGVEVTGAAMRDRLQVVRSRTQPTSSNARPRAGDGRASGGSLGQRAARLPVVGSKLLALRARWWRLMDRAVHTRTADLRGSLSEIGDRTQSSIALAEEVDRINMERIEEIRDRLIGISEREAELEARIDELDKRDAEHEARHAAEPYGIREAGFKLAEVDGIGRALGATGLGSTGDRYADFLAVFRGPYERVLELMKPYGPLLAGHGPLLDVGCGRGELLEVAERAGVEARGVDLDTELVAQAVKRGHDAVVGDGIEAISAALAGSLGAISAIHVVEHLPVEALEAFFARSMSALKPGGLLLVETVNPHEVSAASTFWVDPTHRGPVFPEVALALALSSGFSEAHIFAPDGAGDWEHDRTQSTRYTLLARA